jgi:hypothetical protein
MPLTEIINNSGPVVDPCGTLHFIANNEKTHIGRWASYNQITIKLSCLIVSGHYPYKQVQ